MPARRQFALRVVPAALLAAATVAGVVLASTPVGAQEQLEPQLPDLTEAVPSQISVRTVTEQGRRRYRLAFRSAAENRGDQTKGGGGLMLVGKRTPGRTRMAIDQYVDLFDGRTGQIPSQQVFGDVGHMQYVRNKDHQHWHTLNFERYELRRAPSHRLVAPDRKTGFCVGNRYDLPGAAKHADLTTGVRAAKLITFEDFNSECGLTRPELQTVTVGLSPGSADDYKPLIEGQFIDVTRMAGGRYELVHRVNPSRRIHETRYDNNSSSVLLELTRRRGRAPRLKVLRRCPGVDRCSTE